MARKGITKKQIFEAATHLQEAGIASTVQAVRERIGSGSYSTINAHLAEWRKTHAEQALVNIPDMPEKIMSAFNQVWASAIKSAQEDVETQRQALEVMRREMDKENADMVAEIKRLEKELEAITQEVIDAKAGKVSAEKQLVNLQIENARLDERAKVTEEQVINLRKQLSRSQEQFTELATQKDLKEQGSKRPK